MSLTHTLTTRYVSAFNYVSALSLLHTRPRVSTV